DGLESKLAFLPRLLGAGSSSERLETVLGQLADALCCRRVGLHWPAGPHPQVRVAVDRSGRPAGTPPSPNGSAGPLCGPGGEATLGTAKGTRSWASLAPSPDRPGYLWAEPESPEDWAELDEQLLRLAAELIAASPRFRANVEAQSADTR